MHGVVIFYIHARIRLYYYIVITGRGRDEGMSFRALSTRLFARWHRVNNSFAKIELFPVKLTRCVKAVDIRRATAISQTIRITAIPLIYVHRTRAPVLFHEIMRWRTHAKLTRILHFDENNLVPNARIIRCLR